MPAAGGGGAAAALLGPLCHSADLASAAAPPGASLSACCLFWCAVLVGRPLRSRLSLCFCSAVVLLCPSCDPGTTHPSNGAEHIFLIVDGSLTRHPNKIFVGLCDHGQTNTVELRTPPNAQLHEQSIFHIFQKTDDGKFARNPATHTCGIAALRSLWAAQPRATVRECMTNNLIIHCWRVSPLRAPRHTCRQHGQSGNRAEVRAQLRCIARSPSFLNKCRKYAHINVQLLLNHMDSYSRRLLRVQPCGKV
jgi:hypothetical protein